MEERNRRALGGQVTPNPNIQSPPVADKTSKSSVLSCAPSISERLYMKGYLPQYAPGNCDLFYVCNKFRLKPAKLDEEGRYAGYMNGESTCAELHILVIGKS
eukprot:Skav202857  [mRNA]  locus=scaffold2311:212820:213587:+ [translate_table: standard]